MKFGFSIVVAILSSQLAHGLTTSDLPPIEQSGPVGTIGQIDNLPAPTILLQNGASKLTGAYLFSSNGNRIVEGYRGIPYAQPPVNDLRFRRPVPLNGTYGDFDATQFGKACLSVDFSSASSTTNNDNRECSLQNMGISMPQELGRGFSAIGRVVPEDENCLFINVFKPARVNEFRSLNNGTSRSDTTGQKLPVMVWFYGGAFVSGNSNVYSGESIVGSSMNLGMPVIYVSFNYRVGPWGFLGGQEMVAANETNAGFLDQRLALQWVADHIADFGGDPDNVTIFGQSAGAISIAHQMVYNDGDNSYKGKPLFSKAIMQSGGLIPAANITSQFPQTVFNGLTQAVGCKSLNSTGTQEIQCLRSKNPQDIRKAAVALGPVSAYLAYGPRVDGIVFKQDTYQTWSEGKFTQIPYISGNQEDEGTGFALESGVPDSMFEYLASSASPSTVTGIPNVDPAVIQQLLQFYPSDPSAGSPYRTLDLNVRTP